VIAAWVVLSIILHGCGVVRSDRRIAVNSDLSVSFVAVRCGGDDGAVSDLAA